ncbi:hypothetical protein GS483_00420 [Rhodococcus hoagii]|nr:hypothetical protein [Prescottella equi]NKR90592.1 hypothetical protein [Prescottella equi]
MSETHQELRQRLLTCYLLEHDCQPVTVDTYYAREGIDLPPAGREAHTPSRFRVHVSVLLAEAVAA